MSPETCSPLKPLGEIERVIACAKTIVNHDAASRCYYDDGIFNENQWADISNNVHESAIRYITRQCLIHGHGDDQAKFYPTRYVTNAEAIKLLVRAARLLDTNFVHFADTTQRYRPYIDAAIQHNILEKTVINKAYRSHNKNIDAIMNASIGKSDVLRIVR